MAESFKPIFTLPELARLNEEFNAAYKKLERKGKPVSRTAHVRELIKILKKFLGTNASKVKPSILLDAAVGFSHGTSGKFIEDCSEEVQAEILAELGKR